MRQNKPEKSHADTARPWEEILVFISTHFSFIPPLSCVNSLSYKPKLSKDVTDIAVLDWEGFALIRQ